MTVVQEQSDASHWGIEPIPVEHKRLSAAAIAVLWGDLGVGLLVIVAGALLVAPREAFGFGLSFSSALISIVLGSLIGSALLGVGGVIGAREGRPTMALLRDVLGDKGSWIPTVLNVAQLIGWTAFELWVMALVADRLGERLFGFSSFGLWLVVFALAVLALTLWGPLGVVRVWMQRFGVWVVGAIAAVLTVALISSGDVFGATAAGSGGLGLLGLPMDLVIALPVSWIPLVADYNRFSTGERGSFLGTTVGFAIANAWFYAIGAMLVLRFPGAAVTPEGIALSILGLGGASIAGIMMLMGLLVGETDEAFADVYSSAVSVRNILPKADNRLLIVLVTAVSVVLAGRFTMLSYELFLFLLGSVFVPLLGVWFADYFVLGSPVRKAAIRWAALVPWIAGFIVYHWIAPTPVGWWTDITSRVFGTPLSTTLPWLGASLPSFAVAFGLHTVIGQMATGNRTPQK